jgi:uncharacterized repeat protein (TIGR03803 family)
LKDIALIKGLLRHGARKKRKKRKLLKFRCLINSLLSHEANFPVRKERTQMKRALIVLVTVLWIALPATLSAQVLTILHSFVYTNTDGAQPYAGLTLSGNALFGTTKFGGSTGNGTVFTVNTDGSGFRLIHNFVYTDGGDITADLLLSGDTLYGAAYQGEIGYQGALFSLSTSGAGFTNEYVFNGSPDGGAPKAGLLLIGNTLYGTASGGSGTNANGTVFSVQTNGANFSTLHAFSGADGTEPRGDLVVGGNVLYGTTYTGGTGNLGVIFSVNTDGTGFNVLHSFSTADGTQPAAGLVLSGDTLYGTTSAGGSSSGGTVFSIKTNGNSFVVLHNFSSATTNGNSPMAALLLSSNLLYGTTDNGGSSDAGTVFSINTNGTGFTLVYSFSGSSTDGANPDAPVILIGDSLYGTTVGGGSTGNGTVFGLQISGLLFTSAPVPATNLSVGAGGVFFGEAESISFPKAQLLYQWRLNGVDIPGATDTTLPYSNAQPTNGGNVTLTVGDGNEAETSMPAEFSVSISTSASGNDNFANGFNLGSGSEGVVSSSNVNATRELGEPEILPNNPGGKSIWFRWTPANQGTVVFSTQGSTFDTIMGVYTGNSVSRLTKVPSAVNDDDSGGYLTSKVSFNGVAGTTYNVVVDGFRGASGDVVLSWVMPTFGEVLPSILQAPPKDTIVSNGATVTFVCQPSSGTPSWYFNGQQTGVTGTNFTINSVGDTNIGAYVAEVTLGGGVTATQPAHLQVNVLQDGSTDPNSVAWVKFLDSSSSAFVPPLSLVRKLGGGDTAGFTVSQTFSTVGAPGEPGEPAIAGQIGGAPIWYAYVAPTNGAMVVSTAGSSFNTLLGVFIGPGDSFATLTNIGAGYTTNRVLNGQPRLLIPNMPQGQTNFIVVDGYEGATGVVHLNLALGNPVVIATPPQNQFAFAGSSATFTVGAAGSTPLHYQWQFNGTNIVGATNDSLTISNVQNANTGTYLIVVSNLISVASNSATLSLGTSPVITVQPVSHTVTVNGTATLSVTANGAPPPDYQWMFGGNAVGSNSTALSITNFQSTNQGTYNVVVSNSLGAVTSSNALLLLDAPLRLGAPSLNGGTFQLQLIGVAGGNYVLQESSDLLNWTPLLTNDALNGFLNLSDTNAGTFDHRFYRSVTN